LRRGDEDSRKERKGKKGMAEDMKTSSSAAAAAILGDSNSIILWR
jgi:hypothetical protein